MKYFLVAGEASGDLHASNLMKGLKAEDPKAEFRYWGGDMMASVAPGLRHHYKEGAVMGLSEVFSKAKVLLSNLKRCKQDILDFSPDVLILIDYPGFNMKLAKFAHKKGLKVFYYIAPKTWASRPGRNRQLKRYVDMLYIVFPFEIPYFTKQGIPFVYKGNPLVEAIEQTDYKRLIPEPYVAVLPGSRKNEIDRTLPLCMELADRMHQDPRYKDIRFLVAGAPARSEEDYAPYINGRDYVQLVFGQTYSVLKYAQAAVVNSGTASLEAALIGTPQMVCWSTSPLTAFVARYILRVMDKIKFVSLGNLILDRGVFKEFIQEDFNLQNISEEMDRIFFDQAYRSAMLEGYAQIKEALGASKASRAFAADMMKRLS
ncbi:MAG: lipid-A-disaccharide synthase [Candidatus Cryptobacteroides sp.]